MPANLTSRALADRGKRSSARAAASRASGHGGPSRPPSGVLATPAGRRSRPAVCRSRQERGGSERVRALGLEGSVSRPATYTTQRGHEACGFQHADLTILAKLACALSRARTVPLAA